MTLEGAETRWGPWPERFWNRVEKGDGCWLWQGAKSNGYGIVQNPATGRPEATHRVAYELAVGPIPEGLHLDHLCRNKDCVNPDHLEPVTPRENQARGLKGRLTTHCPRGHEYTPDNTRVYRGHRYCRACHREREQRRRDRRKEEAARG